MTDEFGREDISIANKIVLRAFRAFKTKNDNGYDLLSIDFADGVYLEVLEEGQCGYFSYKVSK